MTVDEFVERWSLAAGAWTELNRVDPTRAQEFVGELLHTGVENALLPIQARAATSSEALRCELAVVRAGGLVDESGYLLAHPSVDASSMDAIAHFCRFGWRTLFNPSSEFDVWWYWNEHLRPEDDRINPGLHFLLAGKQRELATTPPEVVLSASAPPPARPRRACLFAGYDVDGVVDEYVVAYIAELSRHADVYYLADCTMSDDELRKLAPHTLGAWAIAHGRYDFGSWSMLARDLVSWSALDQYDEVLLVNDSCYLLRPLDEVFARMADKAVDWWALQATKQDFRPPRRPVSLKVAKRDMIGRPEWHQLRHLHLSSYFMVLRGPAFRDQAVRRLLDSVTKQELKSQVILKYEVGLSRTLINHGHDFDTFVPDLHPYHPLYTSDYFALVARGFPLLKRNLLSENPLDTPGLSSWKEQILTAVPAAPVDMIERNLLRVAADDRLRRSFSVTTDATGKIRAPQLLTDAQMARRDSTTPTFDHWWAFPVCAYDHTFAGNERALFEQIKSDPSIKKIILTRSRRVTATGQNVVTVPLKSPEGQWHLLRAKQIFVKHAPRVNVPYPLSPELHNFIDLWHGIPLKRFGWAAHGTDRQRADLGRHHSACQAVITSSRLDRLSMTAAFHPLTYQEMWPTGLPRSDFIVRASELLPEDLRAAENNLREEVGGRRLVMFLPTFKDGQEDGYYGFSQAEISQLEDWCARHNAVLGLREHMADRAHTYARLLAPLDPIDLSSRRYPDLEVLYRVADALITDYSSCIVDFLLTGRPVVSFAYDYDRYVNEERGMFYDLEKVIPGPVCRDFEQLRGALDAIFDERSPEELEHYMWCRNLFFDHVDDQNAARVVARVKAL